MNQIQKKVPKHILEKLEKGNFLNAEMNAPSLTKSKQI